MRLVYDFDSTLFATTELWNAWVGTLSQFDFDQAVIEDAGEDLFREGFTLRAHAKELGLGGEELDDLVSRFSEQTDEEAPALVFSDVVPFLEEQREMHEQIILTYGNEEFQHRKIQASGLHEYVNDILIAGPNRGKHIHLREIFEETSESIIFVDNSPRQLQQVHESGLPIQLIRIFREGERHSDVEHEYDDQMWDCISSLEDLHDYVTAMM